MTVLPPHFWVDVPYVEKVNSQNSSIVLTAFLDLG